ncbi:MULTISPECIES: hypothetical protein [Rhodanobacter]|uniref:hypothetical protein n=1 Tax=Rhodanobacter TaxID=75309 RepID=UPI000401AA96|nr:MULTISPECIES: hypothetical protein [Rhodanobacter]TAN18873.1 MAG: hypothetical protein EPN35_02950 [Rhodanobacter sp.]UJJ54011.1 hypothetical protein LRK53_13740 [Rhodanobacter thiooxydans]
MPNNFDVTLDKSMIPWCLDIGQHGNANVSRSPDRQTITWRLTGNAATGKFNSQQDSPPGFAWIGKLPPAGIFGDPELGENGKELSISDLNNSAATSGEWVYQLSAKIGDQVYQSRVTSMTATTTSPTIKNT